MSKNTNTSMTLPPATEAALSELESKHARHQRLHLDHFTRKLIARERHRSGWNTTKFAPNTFI